MRLSLVSKHWLSEGDSLLHRKGSYLHSFFFLDYDLVLKIIAVDFKWRFLLFLSFNNHFFKPTRDSLVVK